MQDFTTLNLPTELLGSLEKMNFNTPTPIQAQAIPHALEGKDILGSAQTGTGKTGAFGIPLVAHLLNNPRGTALIMTPTRELAVQVMQALRQMLVNSPQIKTAVLIGGEPMPKQFQQLKNRPRLIVGTPGRINDHLTRGTVQLNEANFLVLDETDRMLDMGFGIQIDKILKFMPKQRQTLMFSATLPPYIIKMSNQYMNEPVRVSAGNVSTPVIKIEQETIKVQTADKYTKLTEELAKRSGSVIIFVKTKHGADKLAFRLAKDDHEAEAIHGDLRQHKRDRVIKSFREGKYRILVATDVAARGLDIPHIEHVVNFDLPQVADDYIHRIGRTGRNGASGQAVNFVSGEDGAKWKAIQRLLNPGDKGQYEGDGQPQRSSGGGGGRSSSGRGPSSGRSYGGANSNSSPYAKKRPFGSRADGNDRGRSFDAPRGNREDRPMRDSRPPMGRNESYRNSDFRDAPRASEDRGNRFEKASPDRDGNREGGNKSRFEAPRHEGRPAFRTERPNRDAPRSEGRGDNRGNFRNDRPNRDAPRSEARSDNRGDFRPRSDAPRSTEGRGDNFRSDRFAAKNTSSRPEGRQERPRFEGNRSDAPRTEGRTGNGDRKRHEGGRNGNSAGGRSDRPARSDAPRFDAPRGDKPKFFGRSRAA